MTGLLQLDDVGLHFGARARGVQALQGVHVRIAPGERVALVGANGSGKSTLLRVLHGLLVPTVGQRWCAPGLTQAMVFQQPYVLRLSVLRNVALGLWLRGVPWRLACSNALEALARVGMVELAQRNARTLSGGQQQRLALARAWALQPQVLFLDEPTANLDPHAKREVEALVQALTLAHPSMALVFASHNLGQVKRLATRVLYLERGQVLADVPVHDFFNGPLLPSRYPEAHRFVQGELV